MAKVHVEKDAVYASREMVESGHYFKEGLKWHTAMFVSPLTTSTTYITFLVVYAIALVMSVMFLYRLFPLDVNMTLIIKGQHPPETFLKLTKLEKYSTPRENILMSAIQNYVTQRETYTTQGGRFSPMDILGEKSNFVAASSSEQVYLDYKDFIGTYNSLTGNFVVNGVETVSNVTLFEFDGEKRSLGQKLADVFIPRAIPNSATVYFTSINSFGREKKFQVRISYQFKIDRVNEKDILFFVVTSYRVARIV